MKQTQSNTAMKVYRENESVISVEYGQFRGNYSGPNYTAQSYRIVVLTAHGGKFHFDRALTDIKPLAGGFAEFAECREFSEALDIEVNTSAAAGMTTNTADWIKSVCILPEAEAEEKGNN